VVMNTCSWDVWKAVMSAGHANCIKYFLPPSFLLVALLNLLNNSSVCLVVKQ
jgi:hypothetical protein